MSPDLAPTAADTSAERPWPVAHLSRKIKEQVDRLPAVWVEGQVLNARRWRHLVFLTLRDVEDDASMSATIPAPIADAMDVPLAEGARIVVHAKPAWWVKSGSLHLDAREARAVGMGELLARIEALREALALEGLFDDARKVPLPFAPAVVGLVCANQGDAEHDVVENARARWPSVRFEIRRVSVQGARCVPETTAAIRELDALPQVEVIVVARGGGSFEDLLPFSSEAMVRAAAECETPLVSAIGHEKDSPLLDLVADLRASTPTDAARRIVPDAEHEARSIAGALAALRGAVDALLDRAASGLVATLSRPVLVHPERLVEPLLGELARLRTGALAAEVGLMGAWRAESASLLASVRALSPAATLERGYAVLVGAEGTLVRTADDAPVGSSIEAILARGRLRADVTSTTQADDPSR